MTFISKTLGIMGLGATIALATGCMGSSERTDPQTMFTATRGFIPKNAVFVVQGAGPLRYVATWDGTLFIRDKDEPTQVRQFLLAQGQEAAVDPAKNTVAIDGKETHVQMDAQHTHELYFSPYIQK